jgi:hypothetical protein
MRVGLAGRLFQMMQLEICAGHSNRQPQKKDFHIFGMLMKLDMLCERK